MTTTPEQLTQEETIASLGTYGYGWEDAGNDPERFDTFEFRVS